jgi:hypothetical protein
VKDCLKSTFLRLVRGVHFESKEWLQQKTWIILIQMKAMVEKMYEDQNRAKRNGVKGKGKLHKFEKQSKGKEKKNPTCSHYEKKGHDEKHCWNLNPKLKPKWAHPSKGKNNTTTIVKDLGSDSEDETMVTAMGIKGKYFVASFSSHTSYTNSKVIFDGRERNDLFHLRVISKHTNIDTLVDTGSQVNLILDQVVPTLGLETRPHLRPYPLGWICDNPWVQVTKQCKLQFVITSSFIDEVELDTVSLDLYGMVL